MDRQYTLCVLVPAHQYRSYVDNYNSNSSTNASQSPLGPSSKTQAYYPQHRIINNYQTRHDCAQLLQQQQHQHQQHQLQLQLHHRRQQLQQQQQQHRQQLHYYRHNVYHQQNQKQNYQGQQNDKLQQQQQNGHEEQIYENVVSRYQMRMCYQNDYENDEQIQRFYWEQCYRRDDSDATAYYYCEYVRIDDVRCYSHTQSE